MHDVHVYACVRERNIERDGEVRERKREEKGKERDIC